MKVYLYFPLFIFLLSSCKVRDVNTYYPIPVEKEYTDLLVLFVEDVGEGFYELDKDTYDRFIRHKFNNLGNDSFRARLVKSFKFHFPTTFIHEFQPIFEVNRDYTFAEFTNNLSNHQVNSILLITILDDKQITIGGGTAGVSTSSMRSFQNHLIDLNIQKPVWSQSGKINGSVLNSGPFARDLAKLSANALRKENLVLPRPN